MPNSRGTSDGFIKRKAGRITYTAPYIKTNNANAITIFWSIVRGRGDNNIKGYYSFNVFVFFDIAPPKHSTSKKMAQE